MVAVLLVSGAAWAQGPGAPIKNLRIPLEHYEDGKVRTQITAGTASVAETGNITADGVKIEIFARDGSVESRVEAGGCYVDRENQTVTSTNAVRATQKGVSVTGTGFEWHAGDQSFKIHNEARVVFVRSSGLNLFKMP